MARNAPDRASLVRVMKNARAVKNVEKPDRLPVARAMASGAISVRLRMVRVMVNDGSSDRRIVDLARPVRRMARGIMVPGMEIVATLARRRVARVTSARLAMGNAVKPVRLPVVRAMASDAISVRPRMVHVMVNDEISVPRIVVQEAMNATASARAMVSGRAMVVRIEVARGKTA